jgi:hypothetical protein
MGRLSLLLPVTHHLPGNTSSSNTSGNSPPSILCYEFARYSAVAFPLLLTGCEPIRFPMKVTSLLRFKHPGSLTSSVSIPTIARVTFDCTCRPHHPILSSYANITMCTVARPSCVAPYCRRVHLMSARATTV